MIGNMAAVLPAPIVVTRRVPVTTGRSPVMPIIVRVGPAMIPLVVAIAPITPRRGAIIGPARGSLVVLVRVAVITGRRDPIALTRGRSIALLWGTPLKPLSISVIGTRALTVAMVAAVPVGRWSPISVKLPLPIAVAGRPIAPHLALPISLNTTVVGSGSTASVPLPLPLRAPIATTAVLTPTISAGAVPVGLTILRRACIAALVVVPSSTTLSWRTGARVLLRRQVVRSCCQIGELLAACNL